MDSNVRAGPPLLADSSRNVPTPLWSSDLVCGEKTGASLAQTVADIDPAEPSNAKCLLAFE